MDLDWDRGVPHREGAWTFTMSGTTTRKPFAGLNEDELIRHKGELMYPNFMLSLSAEHAAAFTLWPHDPGHTTVLCDFLFHPERNGSNRFRPDRCGRVLGHHQPAGLGDLRIGAAGHVEPGVPAGLLRADGESEPGYPAVP